MPAPPCPPLLRAAVLPSRPRALAALARSLAAAALAASAAGCLVIEPPEYKEPARTAPVLTPTFPPVFLPIHITEQDTLKEFEATVLSEDNGDPVQVALYIDYGKRTPWNSPYLRNTTPGWIEPGTIAGGPRPVLLRWLLSQMNLPDAAETAADRCHTITMMATHAFNQRAGGCVCPEDPKDMSAITWQIIDCDPNEPHDPSNPDDIPCPESCPPLNCQLTECLFCDDPELRDARCDGSEASAAWTLETDDRSR
ncbi:hypothetical protein SOCEGT47_019990 [Sorangium cellulosum]|uniref:Secreted protein n=1 Tax=Sorangium cellulosum TaxID=56 RepID=A0A4P2PYB5_SORCE|nr:hypothetical protein [Sorangium cellulosum]AUX21513.1 hypothetical protein SOCEGT47_019990 [Sorangium cellulosum]